MPRQTPPPERPEGQETDPPEIRLVILASIALLEDMAGRRIEGDLDLRRRALLSVYRRLRRRLEESGEP